MNEPCDVKFVLANGLQVPCLLHGPHERHAIEPAQTDQPTSDFLLSTTDAMVWAETWVKIARERHARDDNVFDVGWMVGWFANAMEVAAREADPTRHRKPAKAVSAAYEKYLTN